MKRIILLLVTLMSFSVMAQESKFGGIPLLGNEIFSGVIDCKIVDQQVIQFVDGKTTRFTGIEGERKIGDELRFLVDITPTLIPKFKFSDLAIDDYGIVVSIDADSVYYEASDAYSNYITQPSYNGNVTLYEDYSLKSRSIFGNIEVQRYYKDDYQITFTRNVGNYTQGVYFNCVNAKALTTGIDKFFEEVAKYR
tara:strand:+ start:72 stop:656 length:585 start_codon:yes stop_codon:yes gene_type:complete